MRAELRQGIVHGSPAWETATLNRDLIQDFNTSVKTAYKFELRVKSPMLVSVNSSDPIFLDINDELVLDFSVYSIKLLDNVGVFRYIAYL